MNFLTLVVFGGLILAVPSLRGSENYDLEMIRTTEGKVYRGIQVLEADRYGLSFRHEAGIAKVLFSSLSPNLRMLYETVEDLTAGTGVDSGEASELLITEENTDLFPATAMSFPSSLVLTTSSRVRIPAPVYSLGGGFVIPNAYCSPVRWSRYDPVYLLSQPYFREVAVRDFLYSSGLLQAPPGVSVRTIYR